MTLAAGHRFAGYRVERWLGQGGMGSVYAVVHEATGARRALKILRVELDGDDVRRRRFVREARAAMSLVHPSIARVFEHVVEGDAHALAMELCDGPSLEAHLEAHGRLSVEETARTLLPIASALGLAHERGIVHRDVKPDNILLTPAGPKLVDFGIAKQTGADAVASTVALTRTGALLGTPHYMSPEQACGEKDIDQRSDVWSLGIVLYRCLSGVLPTGGASFGRIFKTIVSDPFPPFDPSLGIPTELAALVDRALEKRRENRPMDLSAVYDVLSRFTAPSLLAPAFGPSTVVLGASSDDERPSAPRDDGVVEDGTVLLRGPIR